VDAWVWFGGLFIDNRPARDQMALGIANSSAICFAHLHPAEQLFSP
jgi:hypothetical protein